MSPQETAKARGPGRPSDYSTFLLDKALEYIESHDKEPYDDPVPTIEGLAYLLGHGKQILYAWEEAHPEFHDALERLRSKQAKILQAKGLTGKFAPVITKLMLSANHGMAEKSESKQEQTGTLTIVTKVPVPHEQA